MAKGVAGIQHRIPQDLAPWHFRHPKVKACRKQEEQEGRSDRPRPPLLPWERSQNSQVEDAIPAPGGDTVSPAEPGSLGAEKSVSINLVRLTLVSPVTSPPFTPLAQSLYLLNSSSQISCVFLLRSFLGVFTLWWELHHRKNAFKFVHFSPLNLSLSV